MLHCVLSTFFANLFLFPFWFSFFYKMVRLIWEKKNGIDFISIYFFYKFFCLHLGLNFELQTKTSGEARGFKICYAKLGKKMGIHCSIEKLEKWSIISLMMYVYVSPTCTCALLCNVHNFCLFLCFFYFFAKKCFAFYLYMCEKKKYICWGLDLRVKPSSSKMLPKLFAGLQRDEAKHTPRYRMNTKKRKLKDHDLRCEGYQLL